MQELPINNDVSLPALRSAALFQKQIPEYLLTCNKHIRTITKAKRAAANKKYGTAPPRQRLMEESEETHMSRSRTEEEDSKTTSQQVQHPTQPPTTTYPSWSEQAPCETHQPIPEKVPVPQQQRQEAAQQVNAQCNSDKPDPYQTCLLYTSPSPRDS